MKSLLRIDNCASRKHCGNSHGREYPDSCASKHAPQRVKAQMKKGICWRGRVFVVFRKHDCTGYSSGRSTDNPAKVCPPFQTTVCLLYGQTRPCGWRRTCLCGCFCLFGEQSLTLCKQKKCVRSRPRAQLIRVPYRLAYTLVYQTQKKDTSGGFSELCVCICEIVYFD